VLREREDARKFATEQLATWARVAARVAQSPADPERSRAHQPSDTARGQSDRRAPWRSA